MATHVFNPPLFGTSSASVLAPGKAYNAAIEAGDLLWAFVWINHATNTVTGVSDNINGAWTQVGTVARGDANNFNASLYLFVRPNSAAAAANAMTVTQALSANTQGGILIGAVRGLAGGGAVDVFNAARLNGPQADGWQLALPTLAGVGELGAGFISYSTGTGTPRWTQVLTIDQVNAERAHFTTSTSTTANAYGTQGVSIGGAGTATAGAVFFKDLVPDTAPTITAQPAAQAVTAGATATFSATASGSPTPTWQWQRSTNNGGSWSNISGAVGSSYTTPATTLSGGSANNGDQFRAFATNTAGSATTNPATLSVSASTVAPTITTNPTPQSVAEGGSVSFTVAATGTAPLSYQWRKGGANISGAVSATYSIGVVVTGDSGSYDCVVTNSQGSVNSTPATLTVSAAGSPPPPSTTTSAAPIVLVIGLDGKVGLLKP